MNKVLHFIHLQSNNQTLNIEERTQYNFLFVIKHHGKNVVTMANKNLNATIIRY